MKKLLSYIGCAVFVWAGLYFTLIADALDSSPYDQGGLSLLAALLFGAAFLCAGYGNSITWDGEKKYRGRR